MHKKPNYSTPFAAQLPMRWDDAYADTLTELEQLVYRSNLLGADLRLTNYGGGNTSAKIMQTPPLGGADTEVLYVKGSGGDLGSIQLAGFAALEMDKLHRLPAHYRGLQHEDEMVAYFPHCAFSCSTRAASIDTPLHAYIPVKHIDHLHPDAVIAVACTDKSRALTEAIWQGEIGWLPWQRPGFDLGLQLNRLYKENPDYRGALLDGHGLFTWSADAKSCYQTSLAVIQQAMDWLSVNTHKAAFGGVAYQSNLTVADRESAAAKIMFLLRGKMRVEQQNLVGHYAACEAVLEFVGSKDMRTLAACGTSCPDHFLRTKIRPFMVDFNPDADSFAGELNRCIDGLDAALKQYREDYCAYYARHQQSDSPPMRSANPVICLMPGVGMFSFASGKSEARIAGEFYINAIHVMRGATAVGTYRGLCEKEAFNIEYWMLEEAKLKRMPKAKPLAGKIAFITGGAGGIGRATAVRFLQEDACVMLADIDAEHLDKTIQELSAVYGTDRIASVVCDVTDEQSVETAFRQLCRQFGGLDILVSNAGIASAAPLEETELSVWKKTMDVLATGYFLVTRRGFDLLKQQGQGGAIVFIASKNGLTASPNAAAYCAAKAAEIHLARATALEGGAHRIRCNVVNPDAVLRGSRIWSSEWRQERAQAHQVEHGDLEEHYRKRSLLQQNVLPEDIAEAVYFLASDLSAKSTGNIINVDAGYPPSFTR